MVSARSMVQWSRRDMLAETWMDRDRFNKGRRDLAIRQVGSSWVDSMEQWAAQMVQRSLRHRD